ncbi:hypothetical protein SAMN05421820_105372 [Pedobacter steynii]|uniref:IPT/TIG domain-containing protein n=1 Tax=Pedobacter steynii TaxID=430522 RepID=A0A1G9X453_9SPHI|nr:IPT/TIG domain-containing protein [Pedobacter steynii]NQX40480.1 hypothetical protein [Pedobacter steynii]SDM91554.1 hypothetical protein SAMN05421820_105372 [Pedobacter steynii]
MKKKYIIQLIALVIALISLNGCKKNRSNETEQPIPQDSVKISGLIPAQTTTGSEFIINGSGFDPVASNNIVKIGNIALTIKQATTTSLLVNTPANWAFDNISVTTGSMNATTVYKYHIVENPYKTLRLKSCLEGKSDLFEFIYNTNNQATIKNTKFINPINGLTFSVGQTNYSYNGRGFLNKEVYTPLNSNLQTITEYFYTDDNLTSDKVYNFNTDNSSITNLSTHTYLTVGKQLISKVTKDSNGNQVSSENYEYAIIEDVPQVVKITNFVSGGISKATYIQHPILFDPSALLIPGAPRPALFLASSATFTDPSIKNYTIATIFPSIQIAPSVRYQYAGGLSNVITYTYENKQ